MKQATEFYLDRFIREKYGPRPLVLGDGVYVDMSSRRARRELWLGFAIVHSGQLIEQLCVKGQPKPHGEKQAVLVAKQMFPGRTIYCDHQATCNECGAVYVHRSKNYFAHAASRWRSPCSLVRVGTAAPVNASTAAEREFIRDWLTATR